VEIFAFVSERLNFALKIKFFVAMILNMKTRGDPGSRTGSIWDLWWTKRHWGRFSPSTSVSPANHPTDFSIIIITRG
jgi:hypothetical protein